MFYYKLKSLDGKSITEKTQVKTLKVSCSEEIVARDYPVFILMYNKADIPNPEMVNTPGIFMSIVSYENNIITDGIGRKFKLVKL